MSHAFKQDERIRLPEVLKIIHVGKTTWYRGIKNGIYPEGKHISKRAVGWLLSDIERIARDGVEGGAK